MSLPIPAACLPVRLLNRALPLAWGGRWMPPADLDPDRLDRQARRATGLDDYGDPWFWQPLRTLTEAVNREADLTPIGRVIAHGQLIKLLKERLWAEDWFTRHPDIRQRPLADPVVIVGPMRSGTTRLHRLLAADPRFAHLRLFEAMCPVPSPGSDAATDPRPRATTRGLATLHRLNPALATIHPTGPLLPDEELGLIAASAWGLQYEAQWHVPSYTRWCAGRDATPAYRHMADLLRLNGWFRGDSPGKSWVLKTPQHLFDLPALLDVFPGARLIFTHRDPVAVVASSASLAWNQMIVGSDAVDSDAVGAAWLEKTARGVEAAEAARGGRGLDVRYDDLDHDWRGTMRRIYAWLGLDVEPALPKMATALLGMGGAHRGHRYAPEAFGLDPDAVRARFAPYIDRFDLAGQAPIAA